MVEVVRLEDGNLVLLVIDIANVGKEVVLTGIACHEGQPRIGEVEVDAVTYRGAQQRVAAFV